MKYGALISVLAYIGTSICQSATGIQMLLKISHCGPLAVFPSAGGIVMWAGKSFKNQEAFKFAANGCAVRRRARCTTCTLRKCSLEYNMTLLRLTLYMFASRI